MQKILAKFQETSASILKELEKSVERTRMSTKNNQEIQATTQKQFDRLAAQHANLIKDLSNAQAFAVKAMQKGTNLAQTAVRKEAEKDIIETQKTAQANIDSVAELGKQTIEETSKNIVAKLDKLEKIAAKKPNSQMIDLMFLAAGVVCGVLISRLGLW